MDVARASGRRCRLEVGARRIELEQWPMHPRCRTADQVEDQGRRGRRVRPRAHRFVATDRHQRRLRIRPELWVKL
eukprot:7213343-Pyramimonas_sp.AAC.1